MTFLATHPQLYVFVVRDDRGDLEQLIKILTAIVLFFWYHRFIILSAVRVLAEIGYIFQGISQAGQEIVNLFYDNLLPLPITGIG